MTEHAVVIAGAGPTGLMLAGELALAGVDVRHPRAPPQPGPPRLARGRSAIAHDRGPRPARHRRSVPLGGPGRPGRGVRQRPPGHQRLSHPASLRARAVAEAHRAHPRRLGRRAEGPDPLRHRGDRPRAGRRRRRRRAVRRPVAAGRVPRRVRWRTQPGPEGSRHRVPRLGSDDEQPARRGRDDRGAGIGRPPHALGHARPRQGRVRDPDGEVVYQTGGTVGVMLTESQVGHERAHPARSQRAPHCGLRHRLRDPQSHLDHPVHRRDPAGRGLPRGTGPAGGRRGARAFPGRWTGPQHRCAGCGEPGMEAGRRWSTGHRRTASSIRTTPSATRSLPACCAPRWRRSRSCASTIAPRPCATPCPSC